MKIVVYSVNIGGYDMFNYPINIDPNVRYILFTDNKFFKSNVWEVNHIDFINPNMNNILKARYIKTNPHKILPEHDINIWIDHCFTPRFTDVVKLLDDIDFKNHRIMCYKHDERNCIYNEAETIVGINLDSPDIVRKQITKYKEEGFPKKHGLFQSGFMFRRNDESVNKLNDIWWGEINQGSCRDQLSQVYSSWKTNQPIGMIKNNGSVYNNVYITPKTKHEVSRITPKSPDEYIERINKLYEK
jgi:hypothetical protein